MDKLENKYVDLILQKGLGGKDLDSLLIQLDLKEHIPFALKVKDKAKKLGISDVKINVFDYYELHDFLKNTKLDDISLDNPKARHLIDKSLWSEYAKKQGGILFLTSDVPGLMKDIDPEKIHKRLIECGKTNKYYRDNIDNGSFTWTIVALPNNEWAKQVFPNDKKAYEKLYLKIMEACMVDKDDPIKAWNEYFSKSKTIIDNLNSLEIKRLHYQNSLGTDLYLDMPKGHIWLNSDDLNSKGNHIMNNLPSYEIFSSPDCRKTNGIVYASKPLVYSGGIINDFYLVFKDGKVVDYKALEGEELLKQIIKTDTTSNNYKFDRPDRLGEVAFVEYNSPISNTGLLYYDILFDENASCHLALGDSFADAFKNGLQMSKNELLENGLNQAINHVDFMIGTKDLSITAETNIGKVPIIENGNFSKVLSKRK